MTNDDGFKSGTLNRMTNEIPMTKDPSEDRECGHSAAIPLDLGFWNFICHSSSVMRHSRLPLVLAMAGILLVLGGCGYTQKELFPTDVRTVSVPIFANRTFYQRVEFDLSEALVKEIEGRTPYKVVASDHADTILRGTVTDISQRVLTYTRDAGLPQELEVTVTIEFQWTNVRTGQLLRDRKGFAAVGRYIPVREVGERFAAAQHAAVQRLAEDVVSAMAADW
ncbi:MAG: LptE family protein [Phycisphaeraceae bacterium]